MMERLKALLSKVSLQWVAWAAGALALLLFGYLTGRQVEIPDPPPIWGKQFPQGWEDRPEDVAKSVAAIEGVQGFKADFGAVAQEAVVGDDDKDRYLWQAEEKVLGRVLPSWNQGGVGSCVAFGFGRASQDLLLWQIVSSRGAESWPGHEIATEPVYGGSRVEIGGGRIRGDGSVGAWAAQWLMTRGIALRKVYGTIDLSTYSEARCREWGRNGVPDPVEEAAKANPVRSAAKVMSSDDVWNAIGNYYPVAICSNVGFDSPLRDGFCAPRGSWAHCMCVRGRFTHPTRGKCFIIQNSWGNYLQIPETDPNRSVQTVESGRVVLPQGCFACDAATMNRIARQGDSFALSNLKGFPSRKLDTFIRGDHGRLDLAMEGE